MTATAGEKWPHLQYELAGKINVGVAVYFWAVICLGTFFCMNLFVAVLSDSFTSIVRTLLPHTDACAGGHAAFNFHTLSRIYRALHSSLGMHRGLDRRLRGAQWHHILQLADVLWADGENPKDKRARARARGIGVRVVALSCRHGLEPVARARSCFPQHARLGDCRIGQHGVASANRAAAVGPIRPTQRAQPARTAGRAVLRMGEYFPAAMHLRCVCMGVRSGRSVWWLSCDACAWDACVLVDSQEEVDMQRIRKLKEGMSEEDLPKDEEDVQVPMSRTGSPMHPAIVCVCRMPNDQSLLLLVSHSSSSSRPSAATCAVGPPLLQQRRLVAESYLQPCRGKAHFTQVQPTSSDSSRSSSGNSAWKSSAGGRIR